MDESSRWQYRTTVLLVCMAVYFGSRIGQVALSTLGPTIVTSLDTTMRLFGFAFTGLSIASALAQFPSGVLSDRYGERALLVWAAILTCTGTLFLALSPSEFVFVPLMAAVGIGSGLYYTPSTTLLDKRFDQIGKAIGIYRISGQVAGVVAPAIVGSISIYFGWRVALFAMGLVLVPVVVGILRFMRPTLPNDPHTSFRTRVSPRRLVAVLSQPGLAGTTLLASSVQFVEVASFTFLPAILQRHHGLSPTTAGVLYALYFAIVALCQPVSGWLSDRIGRAPVTAILLLAGVLGYGLLSRSPSFLVLVSAVLLVGIAMTWGAPVQSRLIDALGETDRGTGFGLVRTVYLLLGALGSYVTGVLITETGWVTAVSTLAGVLALCLIWVAADVIFRSVG